jgi:hypothetical protein
METTMTSEERAAKITAAHEAGMAAYRVKYDEVMAFTGDHCCAMCEAQAAYADAEDAEFSRQFGIEVEAA